MMGNWIKSQIRNRLVKWMGIVLERIKENLVVIMLFILIIIKNRKMNKRIWKLIWERKRKKRKGLKRVGLRITRISRRFQKRKNQLSFSIRQMRVDLIVAEMRRRMIRQKQVAVVLHWIQIQTNVDDEGSHLILFIFTLIWKTWFGYEGYDIFW